MRAREERSDGTQDRALDGASRIAALSASFLALAPDVPLEQALRARLPDVCEIAGADRVRLFLTAAAPGAFQVLDWEPEGRFGTSMPPLDVASMRRFAWACARIAAGETVVAETPDALPVEAEDERDDMRARGVASLAIVPLCCGDRVVGGFQLECREPQRWSERDLSQLRLAGELFAGAVQRRTAESALRESEARFRAFAENALELILELDRQGYYRYVSPSLQKMLGHTPESWIGCTGLDYVHPDDRPAARSGFLSTFHGSDASIVRHRLQHADGSWRWCESTGRAFAAADGAMRFVCIVRDVTERLRMEEAIATQLATERRIARLSRRFLELEVDALDAAVRDALAEAGRLAGADRAYLFASERRAEQRLGRHYEWCAAGVASFTAGVRRPWAEAKFAAGEVLCFTSPEELPDEAAVERQSLQRRGVRSLLGIPLRTGDEITGIIGFEAMRETRHWTEADVTLLRLVGEILCSAIQRLDAEAALRESESKLAQAQKLEAVGRLAGGIAHDFNNLLTVILGFSRPLLRDLAETDPGREDVVEIHRAAERAAALTRQLLTFSRRQPVEQTPVDLNALLQEVAPLLERLLGEDVGLGLELQPGLPPVLGDAHQFEQVVFNLAANARDAMPEGGSFTLTTAARRFDSAAARRRGLAEAGEFVELCVSDSGHGIDATLREQIFDPFFTTKEPGKGTGLGLSIVYGVVERARGAIRVEGRPDKGTVFEIWLPAAAERVAGRPRTAVAEAGEGGCEVVLLAEDDASVRRLARGILEGAGYRVHEARDGEEALRVASAIAGGLDALVTDVVMPRMGGYALARELRARHPGLRTLLVSGYPDDHGAPRPALDARTRQLEKPFSADTLLAALREVLSAG